MRIMFMAAGVHTVMDDGNEYEFDNRDGSAIPNMRNSLDVPEKCARFLVGRDPNTWKIVDDIMPARPPVYVPPTVQKPATPPPDGIRVGDRPFVPSERSGFASTEPVKETTPPAVSATEPPKSIYPGKRKKA